MGPFGYGNLGDAAIVDALIQHVRRHDPTRELRGFTLDPRDTERRHGITSFPLSRISWDDSDSESGSRGWYTRVVNRIGASRIPMASKIERVAARVPAEFGMLVRSFRALHDVDTLVVCGSGQLQDYWGGGGAWSYPYTMLRWALLARLRGTGFVVLSVGAGPVDSSLSRRFFRWALSLAEYRSYRDEWSKNFVVDSIGHDAGDPVYPDLAFGLEMDRPSEPADGDGQPNDPKLIGIGPMGHFRDGSWPESDPERWDHYRTTMAEFIIKVLADGHSVLFLKGEAHHDQPVIDDIVAEVLSQGVELDGRVVDLPVTTVAELVTALSRCDAIVASRFHNVLLGYVLGRPVLGISYQSKTDSLMAEYGQSAFCLSIADITVEKLSETLDHVLDQPNFASRAAPVTEQKRVLLADQYEHLARIL
jgi:polysaccharide pyruvyl transferase WcaK-like protein